MRTHWNFQAIGSGTVLVAAALATLHIFYAPAPDDEGEIALADAPFCDFFVVATPKGFALLHWRGGSVVFFEGNRLLGAAGMHVFTLSTIPPLLAESLTATAKVENAAVTLRPSAERLPSSVPRHAGQPRR